MRLFLTIILLKTFFSLFAQKVEYPYPVNYFKTEADGQAVQMAYMDIKPNSPIDKTVILFHGKNFNGYYWKDVIPDLVIAGYRVIVPDQVGWGRSSKPDIQYSFHLLSTLTKKLLDSLGVKKTSVIGHSMGGMLATRFALMHPDFVTKLILENPIGLEDYKTFIPYRTTEELYKKELNATYESIKKYQQTYYPEWKKEYEQYVKAQAEALKDPEYSKIAWVNALTYQMIYEQPVSYEFENLKMPVMLLIGQEDRTVVGKDALPKEKQKDFGNYPQLGRETSKKIRNAELIELKGIGHIPHIQNKDQFMKYVISFLN